MHQMTDGGVFLTVVYKVLPFLQPPKPLRSFIPQREGICCFLLIPVFDIWVHRIHIGTTSGHEQHVQSAGQRSCAPIAEPRDTDSNEKKGTCSTWVVFNLCDTCTVQYKCASYMYRTVQMCFIHV